MKKRVLCSTFIFILMCQFGMAQLAPEEDNENLGLIGYAKQNPPLRGIILGIHGARETMFEIGYFNYHWTEDSVAQKIPIIGGMGYSVSTEHYINHNYIIAPKAAIWANALYFNMGMSVPWYFDMEKNNSLRIRPEIGFGSGDFKLTYAFNIAITNKDMRNVSKHMVSAIYFLNFNRKAKGVKSRW